MISTHTSIVTDDRESKITSPFLIVPLHSPRIHLNTYRSNETREEPNGPLKDEKSLKELFKKKLVNFFVCHNKPATNGQILVDGNTIHFHETNGPRPLKYICGD